jgi:HlyD family secretion protein
MNVWHKRTLVLAAVLVAVAIFWITFLRPDPVPVQVVAIERGQVEETVTNSRAGTVRARQRAKLSPEYGGQVIEIPFREGDTVKQGEVLLRLEDSLQKSRLDLAERELEALRSENRRACLEAQRAEREFERTRKLASEDIVSEDLLDQVDSARQGAAAACEAAAANVSRAQASVRLARTELEKTVLKAPFDGVVAEISIEVGEWTTPSPPALPVPPVVDLLDPSSVYISAPMDEVDSARVRVDQPVRATIDSHRDRNFIGRVSRVAPYVLDLEAQNRTVEIEVELDAHDQRFLPGTSADVEIILRVRDDVLRVTTAAIMEGNKTLVLDDGELVERELTPGLRNWDFTEVVGGLEEGELVVTSLDREEVAAGARAEISEDGGD